MTSGFTEKLSGNEGYAECDTIAHVDTIVG
jgi:hypothetical protein